MQVQSDPCSGGRVAQLVRQAGANLCQGASLLRAADLFFVLRQAFGHLLNIERQFADLIVAAGQLQRAEVSFRNPADLLAQLTQRSSHA